MTAGGTVAGTPARPHQAPGWQAHRHIVWPSISAGPTALVSRLGDWTWERVADAYGIDVLAARTGTGSPAYLSFHYCRYRATARFHLGSPTFGDRLDAATLVLGAGPQSTLTLHRVRRDGPFAQIAPDDFHAAVPAGELRVEHLNRWIFPAGAGNTELSSTAPDGFDGTRVPSVPADRSPRGRIRRARELGTFRPADAAPVGESSFLGYTVDAARDLNAVGLLYFASYNAIVDWAVWRSWTAYGRDDAVFLARSVTDQELLYLGNADAGARLTLVVSPWRSSAGAGTDVLLRRDADGVPICISTLTFAPPEGR